MKKIIIFTLFSLLLIACKEREAVLKGRLMFGDCSTPAANMSIFISTDFQYSNYFSSKSNSDGRFEVNIKFRQFPYMNMDVGGVGRFLERIPFSEGVIDLGNVYLPPIPYKAVLKLKVDNPMTANDTLHYCTLDSVCTLPGPFVDGTVIDSFHTSNGFNSIYYGMTPEKSRFFYFNGNYQNRTTYYYETPYCNEDWVDLVIHIK